MPMPLRPTSPVDTEGQPLPFDKPKYLTYGVCSACGYGRSYLNRTDKIGTHEQCPRCNRHTVSINVAADAMYRSERQPHDWYHCRLRRFQCCQCKNIVGVPSGPKCSHFCSHLGHYPAVFVQGSGYLVNDTVHAYSYHRVCKDCEDLDYEITRDPSYEERR